MGEQQGLRKPRERRPHGREDVEADKEDRRWTIKPFETFGLVSRSLLTWKVCRYRLIIQPVLIKLDQRDEAYREILG